MRFLKAAVLIGACLLVTGGCTMYSFGANTFGELGDGTTKYRVDPVAAARNPDWVKVDSGYFFSCGIDMAYALYCWGDNTRGELGQGTTGFMTSADLPTRVGSANDWTDISGGGITSMQDFACGIRTGSLYCWGWNGDGELGLGNTTSVAVPTRVGTATDWKQVSAGVASACGIRTSGALYCWGTGRLGDGTNAVHPAPVRIGTASDWTLVSAGASHACGTRTTGTLFCWGTNVDGEIGDGTLGAGKDRLVPTQVGTATGWATVSAGDHSTCGILAGSLYCWGINAHGELGLGTHTLPEDPFPGFPDPQRVGTAASWTFIANAYDGVCGIQASNLLYCWGKGVIGNGTDGMAHDSPTVSQFTNWITISLGGEHRVGLRNPN